MTCARRYNRRLEYDSIASKTIGRQMDFGVYLPPRWNGRDELPLVVFLHGGGDDEQCLDRYEVSRDLDELIQSSRLPPFIMVVPDGKRGFWRNWYDGSYRYEDYVVDEIIPRVRSLYPIRAGRESVHLMGISMGGAGAMYLALRRSDAFGSAGVVSAPLFDTDQVIHFLKSFFWKHFVKVQRIFGPPTREIAEPDNIYTRIQRPEDLRGLSLFLAAGSKDPEGILATTRAFHDYLKTKGVPHRYLTYQGGHRWIDWRRIFPVILCKHLMSDRACQLPADPFYNLEELTFGR
jgi:enterochelin esterase-like enzyme